VQRYLREHAWQSARADDLFAALDYVSAQSVEKIASGFLDQPGVPVVMANLRCDKAGENRIELRASEWRPLGEPGSSPRRAWTLPVCVATDALKTTTCFTLENGPIARDLGPKCPTWIYPNAGERGYYRFAPDPRQLGALAVALRAREPSDRIGLLSNAWAGVRDGSLTPAVMLDLLPLFDADDQRLVVEQIVGILNGFDRALVTENARPAFQRYVAARLLRRKRSLGWEPGKPAPDDDDRALARRSVLWGLGEMARDASTLREAEAFAARWLKDPSSVASDTAAIAVPLASLQAGAARLADLRAAAHAASSTQDRVLALRSMGMFDDAPLLRQALDVSLTDEIKVSELRYVFGAAAGRRESVELFYAWEKERWNDVHARLPGALGRGPTADIVGGLCTREQLDEARAFFSPRVAEIPGAKRPLDEALEAAGLCVALREHGSAQVTSWLSGHREGSPAK
jgi:aminopeptidase N